MNFYHTDLTDVILIKPKVHEDSRGYFLESFREDLLFKKIGKKINFCQENESMSHKNIFRGLHFQNYPFAQSKLVSVKRGSVLDVVVDLRKKSKTFKRYIIEELSDKNKKQLFIPKGFAHGFLSLTDNTILSYKVDNYYNQKYDSGILFTDPELNLELPISKSEKIITSIKDKSLPLLIDSKINF